MLAKIKPAPSRERELFETVDFLVARVNEEISKRGLNAKPVLVGSVAKGTYLSDPDIDVFIQFSPDISREELEKYGLELGRAVLENGIAKYAEHPYIHGSINGFQVDIVPCYHVTSPDKKISAVDRTPFHTEYVREHLGPGQNDEVRLLKAFMKGTGLYGAEARIGGFSGYLCELLVIKYGTFLDVLKAVSGWRRRVYIHLGNGGAEFDAPLVFIDPVDPARNVASAVSEESKAKFIVAARDFLARPGLNFFFPSALDAMSVEELNREFDTRGTTLLCVMFSRPEMIDDVLYPQMQRTLRAFMAILEDYLPVHGDCYATSSTVFFVMEFERDTLPAVERHPGPPVWNDNASRFINRWDGRALSGPYVIGSRLYVDRQRKHTHIEDTLLDRVKHYTLGKYFEKHKSEMQIHKDKKCIERIAPELLTEYLKRKFIWRL